MKHKRKKQANYTAIALDSSSTTHAAYGFQKKPLGCVYLLNRTETKKKTGDTIQCNRPANTHFCCVYARRCVYAYTVIYYGIRFMLFSYHHMHTGLTSQEPLTLSVALARSLSLSHTDSQPLNNNSNSTGKSTRRTTPIPVQHIHTSTQQQQNNMAMVRTQYHHTTLQTR